MSTFNEFFVFFRSAHLSLLVDDWDGILQLDIIEEAGKEDVGDTYQGVVLLIVKEGICSSEI